MFILFCLDLTQVISQELSEYSNMLSNKQICTLCEDTGNNNYKCTCFSVSDLEDEMIHNFIVCGRYNDGFNKIFERFWDQEIISSKIKKNKDVSFDFIHKLVWKNTIERCQLLLFGLYNKSITLKEIESLYQLFIPSVALNKNERQCQKENLTSQLCALCNAMYQCYRSSLPSPNEWIPQIVEHIVLYNELVVDSKCTDAATVIMKVKKSLKLEKQFKIIEDLANRVCIYVVTKYLYVYIHISNNIDCQF